MRELWSIRSVGALYYDVTEQVIHNEETGLTANVAYFTNGIIL